MKLPSRFSLYIEGTTHRMLERAIVAPGRLEYLLRRLLTGQTIGDDSLSFFGLRVLVDEDTDQGDD